MADLHLIKLSVGTESVDSLRAWQAGYRRRHGAAAHHTRMFPKRRDAILGSGGSIYWVIKGQVRCRQRILDLREIRDDADRRMCAIVLDSVLVETEIRAHRPFQGWRYLKPEDAPRDLSPTATDADSELPTEMAAELRTLGLL